MTTTTDSVTTPSGRTLEGLTAGVWAVDASHSEVGFTARHLMVSKVKGRFTNYDATITVAPNVLDSTVEATVPAGQRRDPRRASATATCKSADFFHVEEHPVMTFRSTGIRENGSDFYLDGDLTIKSVTHPVTFDLEFNGVSRRPVGRRARRLHRRDRDQPQGLGPGVERRPRDRRRAGRRQDQARPRGRGAVRPQGRRGRDRTGLSLASRPVGQQAAARTSSTGTARLLTPRAAGRSPVRSRSARSRRRPGGST